MSTKVKTGKVRASYVNVFKARKNDMNGRDEFGMQLMIPKSDKMTIMAMAAAINTEVAAKWPGKKPATLRSPLRDGDVERPGDEAYKGMIFVNVKSQERPGIVDANLQPVIDSAEFQSGDYCRVSLSCYAYDQSGNRGTSFGLNNVQVLEQGEPLSGRTRAENDFAE